MQLLYRMLEAVHMGEAGREGKQLDDVEDQRVQIPSQTSYADCQEIPAADYGRTSGSRSIFAQDVQVHSLYGRFLRGSKSHPQS